MNEIRRDIQNTVFMDLFGRKDKKYLIQLYQALHPEDVSATIDDLDLVTIENIITNGIYNDLGFLARKKLVILIEAQSTWSPNIIMRIFMYLAKTYNEYIFNNPELKAKLYSNSKIEVPKPELYVLYTGEKGNKPEILSLREEFFSTSEFLIDLQAKVIFAEKGRRDIIGQYISFCVVVKEQFLLHNDKKKAIQEAIRICIENDDLAEYLMQHRKEVEDVMFTLLTQEEATESYGYLQRMEGREEGRIEGLVAAINLLKPAYKDFDSLYKALITQEIFADLTEDEVRKYY